MIRNLRRRVNSSRYKYNRSDFCVFRDILFPTCCTLQALLVATIDNYPIYTNALEKIVTRSLEGGGGSIGPPPSTFDTIHLIDLKFDTHNKLHLYFQLSETTWCLIGNNSQINDVTVGRHLGFSNFQILFKCSLLCLRLTGKQHLAIEIHEIGCIHCDVVSN